MSGLRLISSKTRDLLTLSANDKFLKNAENDIDMKGGQTGR